MIMNCPDCGTEEGQTHQVGCDWETCPFCNHQLLGCGCLYEKLDLDCSPGTRLYEKGPTKAQVKKFVAMLEAKGRIPFIFYPNICIRCGKLWPQMFMVSPEEWSYYVEPRHRDQMLCFDCWITIRGMIDRHKKRPTFPEVFRLIV